MMYESCIFNNHHLPDFPKHRSSSQSHKHRCPIRSSDHLHLSSFDDVHLSSDLTLTGRAERDKSQFKTLTDKRLFDVTFTETTFKYTERIYWRFYNIVAIQ